MIKMRHMFLVLGLTFACALPFSAGPTAADSSVGVGAHVGNVGVHVGVGANNRHRNDRRYRNNRRDRRDYHHRRRYRRCNSWRWHHHRRVCRRWVWRYRSY